MQTPTTSGRHRKDEPLWIKSFKWVVQQLIGVILKRAAKQILKEICRLAVAHQAFAKTALFYIVIGLALLIAGAVIFIMWICKRVGRK